MEEWKRKRWKRDAKREGASASVAKNKTSRGDARRTYRARTAWLSLFLSSFFLVMKRTSPYIAIRDNLKDRKKETVGGNKGGSFG
jgi:hypothetical protein